MEKAYTLHSCLCSEAFDSVTLELRNLTHTTGMHTAYGSSVTGHYTSGDSSSASLYCPITSKSPKEEARWPG